MRSRDRWIGIILALAGVAVCAVAIVGFLWAVFSNNLPWATDQSAREYYLEVGRAYSNGFLTGFFLCFFLVLGAIVLAASWSIARKGSGDTPSEAAPRPELKVIQARPGRFRER